MKRRLLLIDDEKIIRERLQGVLEREGYDVQIAIDGGEALTMFQERAFAVVVTDMRMPVAGGLQVLKEIKAMHSTCQVIVITGNANLDETVRALRLHAFDFVQKGQDQMLNDLKDSIRRAFEVYETDLDQKQNHLYLKSIKTLNLSNGKRVKFEDEITALTRRVKERPLDVEPLKQLGEISYRLCNFEEAERFFTQAVALAPDDVEILYLLGNAHLQTKRHDLALKVLSRALENAKACKKARYSKAVAFGHLNRFEEAEVELNKAFDGETSLPKALNYLGMAFGEAEEYDKALKYFKESINIKRDDLRSYMCYVTMAFIYRLQEKYDDAIVHLKKCIKLRPKDSFVLIILGMVHKARGDEQNYRKCFLDAFRQDPVLAFGVYEMENHKAQKYHYAEVELTTRSNMLSYLTHTLNNTLAGGRPITDQALRIAHQQWGEIYAQTPAYKVLTNLAMLEQIFDTTSHMLDTYKLLVSEPALIHEHWQKDSGGDFDQLFLCNQVIKKVVARLLMDEPLNEQRRILLAGRDVRMVRQAFMETVYLPELTMSQPDLPMKWIETHFPLINVVNEGPKIHFNKSGIRFNILFACLSEMLFNALKYTDGSVPITLKWSGTGEQTTINCENKHNPELLKPMGTGKGLEFIKSLTEMTKELRITTQNSSDHYSICLNTTTKFVSGGNPT